MQYSNVQILDTELHDLLPKIANHSILSLDTSKHLRIRVHSWLDRLQSIVSNNIWRKNRNNYLRLLYIMLEFKEVIEPFTAMPQDQIPTLHKHQINCILLKLTTRIKQKQRDKQNNREQKLNRITPNQMWTNLQNRTLKSQNSTNSIKTILTVQNSQTTQKKKTNKTVELGYENIEILSPISQGGFHIRENSNLSACTYSTIEKYRDFICNNSVLAQTQNVQGTKQAQTRLLRQRDANQMRISELTEEKEKDKDEVRYFKKNRQNSCVSNLSNLSEIQFKKSEAVCNKEFYEKIYNFLKKNEQEFQPDKEYYQIIKQLQNALKSVTLPQNHNRNPSFSPHQNQMTTFLSIQPIHKEDGVIEYQQIFNQNHEDENHSYDYINGQYSQYSQIEIDEGISPEKMKHIYDTPSEKGEGFRRKIVLDNLCQSASEALTSIKRKINMEEIDNFCT